MVDCGTITVTSPFDSGGVSVDSCSVGSTAVDPGGSTSVTVRASNTNVQPASATVVVTLNGEMVTTGSVTVPAEGTQQTTLSFSVPSSAGDYTVAVSLTDVGQSQSALHSTTGRAFAGFGALLRAPARALGCASCGSDSGVSSR